MHFVGEIPEHLGWALILELMEQSISSPVIGQLSPIKVYNWKLILACIPPIHLVFVEQFNVSSRDQYSNKFTHNHCLHQEQFGEGIEF